MSQYKTRNSRKTERSKSCGRLSEREPSAASPCASQRSSRCSTRFSPATTKELPAGSVNKNKNDKTKDTPLTTTPALSHVSTFLNTGSQVTVSESISESITLSTPPSLKILAERVNSRRMHVKGDNKGNSLQRAHSPPPNMANKPDQSTELILAELKDIKQQINKIEANTSSLAEQLIAVVSRTTKLEADVESNTSTLKSANDEIATLKASVEKQGECLASVSKLKGDLEVISKNATSQKQQLDSISKESKQLKEDILLEVNKQVDKIRQESRCQKLKDQAFNKRHNLVITGLPEDKDKSTLSLAQDFITKTLSIDNATINSAYRIGVTSEGDSTYARPIIIKFNDITHRNTVWRNRSEITREDCEQKMRVQADLPKALREGVQNLYKVVKAASKVKEFESAQIRDYQLELNGETYQITELEKLPNQLKPSTLAAPSSGTTLAFFSRNSFLSNHYQSKFTIDGRIFHSMEQYLALQRAVLSGDNAMIKKARKAREPLQAKYILNSLKNDHQEEWERMVEEITLEGLRGKFSQDQELKSYLCSTHPLSLGEASTNPVWGIGMDLNDKEVLNQDKWIKGGNLLGRCLMEIRAEIMTEPAEQQPPISEN